MGISGQESVCWKKTNKRFFMQVLTQANEKYKGDALLQKVYTVDFLSKKKKVNQGEVPQYYVENNHQAIIDPQEFDMVQKQMALRHGKKERQSSISIFSSKIRCGDCGSWYGSKIWHSTSKYRRIVWQCNHKFNREKKCKTPHLKEDTIKEGFIKAVNILFTEKEEVIQNLNLIKDLLFPVPSWEGKQSDKRKQSIQEKQIQREKIEIFLTELKEQEGLLTEFDEELWYSLVAYITVFNREEMVFTFQDGTEIKV